MSVKLAIVGVGNCANSLMQGLRYYSDLTKRPHFGLVRPEIGGYRVEDIDVVAAFDVVENKCGRDLQEAIWARPNDTFAFAEMGVTGVIVARAPTYDGLGRYIRGWVEESRAAEVDVTEELKRTGANVVVNYLPVGSDEATRAYARSALVAGCAFVNCMPSFIGSDPEWEKQFVLAGLPIIGDDIKSQVGATIVHRVLAQLFRDRGVHLDRTMQLNVGGNNDFLNMLERERLASKKVSKTEAVVSISGVNLDSKNVHIGPSDYVEWLGDKKWAYMRLEGRGFGGAPMSIELKLDVWDSPNSAGIVIDAVRCAALALDRGLSGCVIEPSAYFMKRPPVQMDDDKALVQLEKWLECSPEKSTGITLLTSAVGS